MDSSVSRFTHSEVTEAGHMRSQSESASTGEWSSALDQNETLFENPFSIEDLLVFDDTMLKRLGNGYFGVTLENLARSLQGSSPSLLERIKDNLSPAKRAYFLKELYRLVSPEEIATARRSVLDNLFWELTYWKTPELYEELVAGEQLHPGIFQRLEQDIRGKVVLDAGAGCGRATFECMRHGARLVYAVEPSPGLLSILQKKVARLPATGQIRILQGSFDKLPLGDSSVDMALSCSAFSAEPEQGGELGLAELKRVTRPGGKLVVIWPRIEDYDWLEAHGFHYVALPLHGDMRVHFRSLQSALRCARRFYAHNKNVIRYILKKRRPEVPFSVLGFNPPRDYFWLEV